jgi:hypothetical protein
MHLRQDEGSGGYLKSPTRSQPVKTFDAGTIDGKGYASCLGIKSDDNQLPDVHLASKVPAARRKKVIIVGAGVNGVQQASTLLRDGCVSLDEIQIFDALEGFGGVWKKNNYPGCACDVPAMIYTTSYEINRGKFSDSS